MRPRPPASSILCALSVAAALSAAASCAHAQAAQAPPDARANRISIEYVPPKDPVHQKIYAGLKQHRALEMVQTLFSPLKLTVDLTVKVTGCDGIDNAWYQRQVLTICYEYIDKDINANVPKEMTADGISPMDAMVGQFLYTVCHEMGHAVFAALDVPLFGREEDAADAFATYLILKVGKSDARRLLKGAAYTYQKYLAGPRITAPVTAFADEHGAPLQRYYNMLCIALGAMPEDFSDIVDKGGLPASRARRCRNEFNELNYAFQQLIVPHLDPELAKVALAQDWLPKPEKPPMALK